MIRMRALLVCLSATTAAMVVLAAPAHATLDITAPAENATIGGTVAHVDARWSAVCPAGMACGEYSNGKVYENVSLKLDHATIADPADVTGDTWAVVPAASGGYDLYVGTAVTGGAWKLTASWQECTAAVAPATAVDGATCTTVTATRNLRAVVLFGTKRYPALAYAAKPGNKPGKLQSSLSMGCNGPKSLYRANLEVLKQVKVKGKLAWVSARQLKNQAPVNAGSQCDWTLYTAFPSGIANSTKLRSRFVVRAVGMGSLKPKTVLSKVYTRASLSSGGGSIVING